MNDTLKHFSEFVKNLTFGEPPSSPTVFKDAFVLLARGGATLILTGDDANGYGRIVNQFYDDVSDRRHVSKKAVENLVADCLVGIFREGDLRSAPEFDRILNEAVQALKRALFEKPQGWEMHLKVDGLAPSGLPIRVGNVDFRIFTPEACEALSASVLSRVGELHSSPEQLAAQITAHAAPLVNTTVATFRVDAVDFGAAEDEAKRKLRTTLDAINSYCSPNLGGWVFLPGDTFPQSELMLGVGGRDGLHGRHHRQGPIRKIALNQIASRPGFSRVSDLLAKEKLSDLGERILAAVQWAGRAQIDDRREEAFLLFAIALESLILGKSIPTELTHQLAFRCAHLGGGPKLEDRKLVVEQIEHLYDLRSKIVHRGSFEVTENDLELIRTYTVVSLSIVLDREPFKTMTSVKEFNAWFETQLLSRSGELTS